MKLGFIGTGNMAGAIMGGVIKSNVFKPKKSSEQIFLHQVAKK